MYESLSVTDYLFLRIKSSLEQKMAMAFGFDYTYRHLFTCMALASIALTCIYCLYRHLQMLDCVHTHCLHRQATTYK